MIRGSLAQRVTVACLLVAVLAVGVAAVVALRLVSVTAREVGSTLLGQQADVVAAQLADGRAAVGCAGWWTCCAARRSPWW